MTLTFGRHAKGFHGAPPKATANTGAAMCGTGHSESIDALADEYGAGRSVPILRSYIDDDDFHHRLWRLLVKTPRDASLLKARLERTLKKTNSRIVSGWSDPQAQKARIEQRIASLTPA